jgi:hypothetical protein
MSLSPRDESECAPSLTWGLCPHTPEIYRFGATMARLDIGRFQCHRAFHWSVVNSSHEHARMDGQCPPTIAAAESALRSHPCGALPSAQLRSVSPNVMNQSRDIQ